MALFVIPPDRAGKSSTEVEKMYSKKKALFPRQSKEGVGIRKLDRSNAKGCE